MTLLHFSHINLWSWSDIACFLSVSLALGLLLLALTTLTFLEPKIDWEKSSVYECGFNAFGESRYRFDIKFYLVSILFVIFDVEILYFFPWALSLAQLPWLSVGLLIFFCVILFLGLIYEISRSVLDFQENC